MKRLIALLGLQSANLALTLGAAAILGAALVATIYFMEFDIRWVAFLGGILFAAVVAMGSRASRAEWVIMRRTAQLERVREQLNQEIARGRNTSEAMRLAEARLRLVTDALPNLLLYIDRDGRCQYFNQSVARLTGLSGERINGQFLREIVGNPVYLSMVPRIEEALSGRPSEYDLSWDRPGAKGVTFRARQFPYPPGDPRPHGFYLLLTRITAPPDAGPSPAAPPPGPQAAATTGKEPPTAGDAAADSGETLYLRSITDDLMGWDDPRGKLARALDEDQFLLFAQKILSLKHGLPDPICLEILLRLQEEEDNLLPPGGFLPLAERYGMMEELDRWVVRSLISWCLKRTRSEPGMRLPLCSVNLSDASVVSAEFARFVVAELQIARLSPRTLCFEIGEQDAINHHSEAQRLIGMLKPAGCLHTIDAFGSTKVAFSYLKGLPVDFLKIDGNIIQYILRDPAELAKTKAINTVCQKIGVRTIAEFVENRETLAKLREIGVDYVQGFGVARPEPLTKLN